MVTLTYTSTPTLRTCVRLKGRQRFGAGGQRALPLEFKAALLCSTVHSTLCLQGLAVGSAAKAMCRAHARPSIAGA